MASTNGNGNGVHHEDIDPSSAAELANPGTVRGDSSLIRRSMHVMTDLFSPFSSTALASLPRNPRGIRDRAVRADRQFQNYHATDDGSIPVPVPKKVMTPIRVETKVWLALERTWVSYVNVSLLIGTLAIALYNSSKDTVAKNFGIAYALISLIVLLYGYVIYQKRITKVRKRDPSHFDELVGPVLICASLFFAVLTNFLIRVNEIRDRVP